MSLVDEHEQAYAAPPVFEGEAELTQVPSSFPWQDLQLGIGEFCTARDESKCSKWKSLSTTSKDGVLVNVYSRQLEDKGGLSEFLIRGKLPVGRDTYFALNADMEYRPDWDTMCVSLNELSSTGPTPEEGAFVKRLRVLHWEVNYPWPLGRRDYILEQTIHSEATCEGLVLRCIQGHALEVTEAKALRPVQRGVTRVEDYQASMVIWEGECEQEAGFALLYFEDAKVSLPGWLLSKLAAATIPSQLISAVPVARQYQRTRLWHTLVRYGVAEGSEADGLGRSMADEEDAFFSASDDDDEPPSRRTPAAVRPTTPGRATKATVGKAASKRNSSRTSVELKDLKGKLSRVLRLSLAKSEDGTVQAKLDGDHADLEEGVLVVGKEERDLLLSLLAETRARQGARWWLCPCRRRCCTHKRHHKL